MTRDKCLVEKVRAPCKELMLRAICLKNVVECFCETKLCCQNSFTRCFWCGIHYSSTKVQQIRSVSRNTKVRPSSVMKLFDSSTRFIILQVIEKLVKILIVFVYFVLSYVTYCETNFNLVSTFVFINTVVIAAKIII